MACQWWISGSVKQQTSHWTSHQISTFTHLEDWYRWYLVKDQWCQKPIALYHSLECQIRFIQPASQLYSYHHPLTFLEPTKLWQKYYMSYDQSVHRLLMFALLISSHDVTFSKNCTSANHQLLDITGCYIKEILHVCFKFNKMCFLLSNFYSFCSSCFQRIISY